MSTLDQLTKHKTADHGHAGSVLVGGEDARHTPQYICNECDRAQLASAFGLHVSFGTHHCDSAAADPLNSILHNMLRQIW